MKQLPKAANKIIIAEMWLQNYHRLFSVSYISQSQWKRKKDGEATFERLLSIAKQMVCAVRTQCDG